MEDEDLVTPDLTDIPVDDEAERPDAEVEHLATEAEVEETL